VDVHLSVQTNDRRRRIWVWIIILPPMILPVSSLSFCSLRSSLCAPWPLCEIPLCSGSHRPEDMLRVSTCESLRWIRSGTSLATY
jgi:hypothetical protein